MGSKGEMIVEILKFKDIEFSKESTVDQFGRVFFYQDKVYRLIYNSIDCKEFLNSLLYTKLVNLGYIVKTTIVTDFEIEGYELILEHQKMLNTKPNEWSFLMYKEAALLIFKINEISNEFGYELKDAHPWNVLFDGYRPVFIDIGSFQKSTNKNYWNAKHEFIITDIFPLLLWSKGEYCILRLFLENGFGLRRFLPLQNIESVNYVRNILKEIKETNIYKKGTINLTTTSKIISFIFIFMNRIIGKIRNKKDYNFFTIQERYIDISYSYIDKISKKEIYTPWENYHSEYILSDNIKSTPRFDRIMILIKELCSDSQSAIDLAGNQGAFAFLLEKMEFFKSIILTDYDENAIDKAYGYIKRNNSKVHPLLVNFMSSFFVIESFTKRIKADVVFALAVTHHLVLSQNIPLPIVFEKIALYSSKYVIIEFMPLGLWGGTNKPEIPIWYNQDWFQNIFEDYFELLHIEQLEANRIVFIGKKRNTAST
jgi:hypothetical protein